MEIRLMDISDYEAVYSLWLSCKGMGLNDIDDSREGIEKYLKRNPSTCFVATSIRLLDTSENCTLIYEIVITMAMSINKYGINLRMRLKIQLLVFTFQNKDLVIKCQCIMVYF